MNASNESEIFCRDSWLPRMRHDAFSLFTCAKCFLQVFMGSKNLTLRIPPAYPYLLYDPNNSNVTFEPDPDAEHPNACSEYLTGNECDAWRSCCQAATDCCMTTQQTPNTDSAASCSATWDGVSCWPGTPGGVVQQHVCPDYYMSPELQWLKPQATKVCGDDGMWGMTEVAPGHYVEMTDYTPCYDSNRNTEILKIALYIDFAGNSLSIAFLLAAILLILTTRTLRYELYTRTCLQLHFSLFVSMVLSSMFTVVFHYIYYNALTQPQVAIYRQNAIWCRTLHILSRYFKSTSFLCMFCEGLYLFRKILHVMKIGHRESLLKYLIIGWAFPALVVMTYVIVRVVLKENDKCWVGSDVSPIEFIVVIPSIVSLLCNLLFLVSIQWMLCTKMRSDTSDKRIEVLRRALVATFYLMPVFGVQFLFLTYKPRYWPPYEIIVAVFSSTQGFLVAVLYCFATKEVKEEASKIYITCCRLQRSRRNSSVPCANNIKTPKTDSQSLCQKVRRLSFKDQKSVTASNELVQNKTESILLQDMTNGCHKPLPDSTQEAVARVEITSQQHHKYENGGAVCVEKSDCSVSVMIQTDHCSDCGVRRRDDCETHAEGETDRLLRETAC